MNANWKDLARATLEGHEAETMTFPESLTLLMAAGFDGYAVDFRRSTRTYYMPSGQAIELETHPTTEPVADRFDVARITEAIREAQATVPGYTYKGFCAKVARAGCAGYLVSLLGKRVLYHGRAGETYTEYFPGMEPPERS
jgi:uncharacterized protein YbcV (DUF1398 family)